jgi:hypothetical protein
MRCDKAECSNGVSVELAKERFRPIEKAGAMEVLRELVGCHRPLVRRQRGTVEQVLVHADRALGFTLAPEQRTQREMEVDRLRVDLDDLDKRLDRLVGLLVQQEIEAAEIRQRQRARFGEQMLDVDARGNPTHRKKDRGDRQQPPELEIHTSIRCRFLEAGRRWLEPRSRRRRGAGALTCVIGCVNCVRCSRRIRLTCRLSRATLTAAARRPSATPAAKAINTTNTRGACHA